MTHKMTHRKKEKLAAAAALIEVTKLNKAADRTALTASTVKSQHMTRDAELSRNEALANSEKDDEYAYHLQLQIDAAISKSREAAIARADYRTRMREITGSTTGAATWVCADGKTHATTANCEHIKNVAKVAAVLGGRDYTGGTTLKDSPLYRVGGLNVPNLSAEAEERLGDVMTLKCETSQTTITPKIIAKPKF
jgi:hypothetical protein